MREASESIDGRVGEPFTMVVELGKVREFARATKSANPAYDGAPGDRPVSPGTFLMSSAFWTGPDSDPWQGVDRNFERLLHGEQEFVFHGEPPRVGDELTGRSRIDRVYTKQGNRGGSMQFTETVTEYRDATGRLVAEVRGTSIETSQATTEG